MTFSSTILKTSLSFWFEASPNKSFLLVHVQEILTEEEVEDEYGPD